MKNFSEQIRKFNRFELKYMLTLRQAEEMKQVLAAYMLPDDNGGEDNRYGVSSLYYDSPNYRCYWEKENGIKTRRKLRIRYYERVGILTDEAPVFLEIKQRVDRVTQKQRVMLPYADALRLCQDRQIPECASADRAIIEEAFAFLWQYNLKPSCIIRYDRQALVGTIYDPGLRVTFDTDITFQIHPLHLLEECCRLPVLSPHRVIMEIKVNERMPDWLTGLIAVHNLNMIRISKYCSAIVTAWGMLEMQNQNRLLESAGEVLSSTYSFPLFWKQLVQSKNNLSKKDI